MERREFISLLGGAVAIWPAADLAQQTGKVRTVVSFIHDRRQQRRRASRPS
jgi:hypothetical protein